MSTFNNRFLGRREYTKSVLCVGLDPDPTLMPEGFNASKSLEFLSLAIDVTTDLACAYKPNLAFFEALGSEGWIIFEKLVRKIRSKAPGSLIIADAKRGDLGNTARFYAETFFDRYDCDGLTVNPYMGIESLAPYDSFANKGVFALCLTSNPGAAEFQMQGTPALFERVAASVSEQNKKTGNYWMVAGATRSDELLKRVKASAPDVPLLIPGVGAQGGELESVLKVCGKDVLINSSRGILYAHRESGTSPVRSIRTAAEKLHSEIKNLLGL